VFVLAAAVSAFFQQSKPETEKREFVGFDAEAVNFGAWGIGDRASGTIEFTNNSDVPLTFVNVVTSCGCLTQDFEGRVVLPNTTERLAVSLDLSDTHAGDVIRKPLYVTVSGDGIPSSSHTVTISADVVAQLSFPKVIVLNTAQDSNDSEGLLTVRNMKLSEQRFATVEVSPVVPGCTITELKNIHSSESSKEKNSERTFRVSFDGLSSPRRFAAVLIKYLSLNKSEVREYVFVEMRSRAWVTPSSFVVTDADQRIGREYRFRVAAANGATVNVMQVNGDDAELFEVRIDGHTIELKCIQEVSGSFKIQALSLAITVSLEDSESNIVIPLRGHIIKKPAAR